MLEWLLILSMAAMGALAFAILFKAAPSDNADMQNEKSRQALAKMASEEEKKRREEQKRKEKAEKKQKQKQLEEKQKQMEEKQKQLEEKKNKNKPVEKEVKEVQEKPVKEIYVPNVPIHNNTPTTKLAKKLDSRTRSPTKEEKKEKKEVAMPSKKEIERDMSQGFVVVQKKGPPPLTQEQKEEREKIRQREEEEEKKREKDAYEREKQLKEERLKRASEGVTATDSNPDTMAKIKEKLEKERIEKEKKDKETKKAAGGMVKVCNLNRMAPDEEAEIRRWGTAMAREGEEGPAYDTEDYPSL